MERKLKTIVLTIALVGTAIVMNSIGGAVAAEPQKVANQNEPQTLLFVRTAPAGASIRLEGKELGKSDGIFPVDPGTYKIVIDLTGHEPNQQQITIREGRITRIELTLNKEGTAAADAAPISMDRLLNDRLLTDTQRACLDYTQSHLSDALAAPEAEALDESEREKQEDKWIEEIKSKVGRARIPAINALVLINSSKATPALLEVAAAREEGDNRDRWVATRALGIIGDRSAIPDLVDLTYHYNLNTRLWAQISLVRLTGKNFGPDVDAWRKWWKEQGGTPEISKEKVVWTKRSEWADPAKQEEADRMFLERMKASPPRVVSTVPEVGATDVDPDLESITVTFDQDMAGGYSFTGGGPDYPTIPSGKGPVWKDKRTCVLPVKLEKAHFYRVGINSQSFQNFRSEVGLSAIPSAIYFTTEGASEELKKQVQQVPEIVSITPENGSKDVDPNITEIRVTFNMPMGAGFSWTGGGPHFPEIPAGAKPSWSEDGKTCTLPVKLKPGWDYTLGLNSISFKNFQSSAGIPLKPVLYEIRTKAE